MDAEDRNLASWLRQLEIQREIETHRIAEICQDTPMTPGGIPGDPFALRGVPICGVHGGIGSTLPGTDPLGELLRKEARRGR